MSRVKTRKKVVLEKRQRALDKLIDECVRNGLALGLPYEVLLSETKGICVDDFGLEEDYSPLVREAYERLKNVSLQGRSPAFA